MKSEAIVKMELRSLIESCLITLKETERVWGNKPDITEFQLGRYQGVIFMGKDFLENFMRFADRIGIDLKENK